MKLRRLTSLPVSHPNPPRSLSTLSKGDNLLIIKALSPPIENSIKSLYCEAVAFLLCLHKPLQLKDP